MKFLYKIFIVLIVLTAFSRAHSQGAVTNTMTNFFADPNGTGKLTFDIFTLRTSSSPFNMGNSSYIISVLPAGALDTPITLTNVNPRFTAGSPSNSYLAMNTIVLRDGATHLVNKIAVQINNIGAGDTINGDPNVNNGKGERIATVSIQIRQQVLLNVSWDLLNSAIVNPSFQTATSTWSGNGTVILPVELSNFSSLVKKNDVSLLWTTARETNNHGFDIERKSVDETSVWSKIGFVNGSGTSTQSKTYTFNDNGLIAGGYKYRLKQIDFNGNFEYFNLENEVIVGVPTQYELSQNFPNPFNPSTKINFAIPNDGKVSLNIYDISGRLVSTLINNEFKSANYYTVEFNGNNLSSGTYFYTLNSGQFKETRKMVLVK